MAKDKTQRQTVEIGRKRVPLKKLLNGQEIRDAAKALEDFRLNFTEKEFLYGGKITLEMDSYGECVAVVRRSETDNEYAERLEKQRLAEEAKKERERKRKLREEERALREAETRKQRAIEALKAVVETNGLTLKDIESVITR